MIGSSPSLFRTGPLFWTLLLTPTGCAPDKGPGGGGGVVDSADSNPTWTDEDGDGFTADVDCDDTDPAIRPGGTELCDGIDNDCDGDVDNGIEQTWFLDADDDGYGDPDETILACARPDGAVPSGTDCDDADAAVYPGASERCDHLDNDCDDDVDEGLPAEDYDWYYLDEDGDGFGSAEAALSACDLPPGYAPNARDCDDREATVYPGAPEISGDGLSNDCDSCWATGLCSLDDAAARLLGDVEDGAAGGALAGLGDWEGDGDAELAVGAPDQDQDGLTGAGSVAILSGPWVGDRGLEEALVRIHGEAASMGLGAALLTLQDLDGDDASELAVSGPGGAGGVWLLSSALRGPLLLSDALASYEGERDGDAAGGALAGGGDMDGDGGPDLLIGAARWPALGDYGAIYLVTAEPRLSLDLADATARWEGERTGDDAGAALGAGDLDGDGQMDAAMGAPGLDGGGRDSGGVMVILGGASGGSLADADGRWLGEAASDQAGAAVVIVDLDGDGLGELAVGAPAEGSAGADAGAVYLLDTTTGSGSLASARALLLGEDDGCEAGTSLAAAGDTNADGLDELLIGQPGCHAGAPGFGSAAVVRGTFSELSGTLDLEDAAVRWTGTASGERAGESLAGAGDIDGDGRSDLLIGAPESDDARSGAGLGYLVYGGGATGS